MWKFNPEKIYFFDGAMGTMLQSRGLKLREIPEILNLTNPEMIRAIHKEYADAGADFITANTFGANPFKLKNSGYKLKDIIQSGLSLAREASNGACVALDIGSTGRVMAPSGDASFSEVYDAISEMVDAGKNFCDVILNFHRHLRT